MTRTILIALALVGTAGAVQAQVMTYPSAPPRGPVAVDQDGYLRDSRGNIIDRNANRVIGSNQARPGPGDYGQPPAPTDRGPAIESSGSAQIAVQPPMSSGGGVAMRDEYGNRYDAQGNRIR
jgi:hypothetical protein